jgi:dihydrofolate reductase
MIISIIVAASTNNAIGKNNNLLWRLPNDLKFFKNTTWGHPIIMGTNTYKSIGSKPLPGRKNIIISNSITHDDKGTCFVKNVAAAIEEANKENTKEIFIIGGASIYNQTLLLANRIYLTRVHTHIEGDVYFEMPSQPWQLVASQPHLADEKHQYAYDFEVWEKNTL